MRRATSFVTTALFAALLLRSVPGTAAPWSPRYTFSGFGTIGYAALDEPGAEYRSGKGGDGADVHGTLELDSRLGLQLDVEATTRLSGTVQTVVRENEDGEAGAELEWAFLSWMLGDSLMLRAGRLALPLFAASDYREVGYANTLVRPPEDVYVQVPLRRYDGIELNASTELGETLLGARLSAGRSRGVINAGLESDARRATALILSAEHGPLRVRFARAQASTRLEDDGQIAALRAGVLEAQPFVPALSGLVDEIATDHRPLAFDALGLALDLDPVFVEAEYTRLRTDYWGYSADSWYAMVGTRLGAFTPFAFVSSFRDIDDNPAREIELPAIDALAPLRDGLDVFYEPRDQQTLGLGLRWDVAPRLALKFQVERVSRRERGISFIAERSVENSTNRTDDGDDATLYALTLDFFF